MTSFFNPPNFLGRSLIGAVGLGVALLGLPQSAKALTINASTYGSTTLSGTTYTLPGIGTVAMQGVPLPSFPQYDTIIHFGDCISAGTSCTTESQIQGLSLKSASPVSIGGFSYDMFVSLYSTQSLGSVTFDDSNKTWSMSLPVTSGVTFTALNGGSAITGQFNSDTLTGSGTYIFSGSNVITASATLSSPTKIHAAGNMVPVPWETDALPVVGSTVLFGLGIWAKSKFAKSTKNVNFD
jgi:hypothetical protein